MEPVLRALLRAIAELRQREPVLTERLRLTFVGTNYAPRDRTARLVQPIAERCGVGDLVEEYSERLPYHETLALYAQSDAVLLIGSVSADYTASKLFNCVLARKPVLALLNARSLASQIAAGFPNVFLASFDRDPSEPQFVAWLSEGLRWALSRPAVDGRTIEAQLGPWSARQLTAAQCGIFDHVAGA
jgi:hypothetical protein